VRQGDRVRIMVEKTVAGGTRPCTGKAYGLPNAMELACQVLLSRPCNPGDQFLYSFTPPECGDVLDITPACRTAFSNSGADWREALIIESRIRFSSTATSIWMLSDWRLTRDAQVAPDSAMQWTRNGRPSGTP